jgi:hypothetical protein
LVTSFEKYVPKRAKGVGFQSSHYGKVDRMKSLRIAFAGLGFLFLSGCASYYQVTDPTTSKIYYTSSLDQSNSGATTLIDARTGDKVTLQNSVVEKITEQQFDDGKSGTQAPPAAATH